MARVTATLEALRYRALCPFIRDRYSMVGVPRTVVPQVLRNQSEHPIADLLRLAGLPLLSLEPQVGLQDLDSSKVMRVNIENGYYILTRINFLCSYVFTRISQSWHQTFSDNEQNF